MTNPSQPPPGNVTNVTVTQPPTNTLGLAGFITSILGLVSCGVLSPVGLVLSFIGLFKQPRGFAIAGTIIGLIGTVFLALVGVGIVLGLLGLGQGFKVLKETAATHEQAMKLYAELQPQTQSAAAGLPAATVNTIAAKYTDGWGTPLRAQVAGGMITITSAGRDKQFDTEDDMSFDEVDLQATTRPAATQAVDGDGIDSPD